MEGETGERIMAGVSRLHEIPLVIDDQGSLSLFDVASKARRNRFLKFLIPIKPKCVLIQSGLINDLRQI